MKELRSLAESSNVEAELQDVDLFKLLTVFEKVLKRQEEERNKPVHQVIQFPYTIEGQKEFITTEGGLRWPLAVRRWPSSAPPGRLPARRRGLQRRLELHSRLRESRRQRVPLISCSSGFP